MKSSLCLDFKPSSNWNVKNLFWVFKNFDKLTIKTPGVKIGYYNPIGIKRTNSPVKSIRNFVKLCIPALADARVVDITDADQCSYDLVEDNEFILGKLAGYDCIFVGAGWNGTGYKFAPLVGKILAQLAINGLSLYDITRFSPERFL